NFLPQIEDDAQSKLAEKFVSIAHDISGDLVLRATGAGANVNELIGVVLAQQEMMRLEPLKIETDEEDEELEVWLSADEFKHWFEGKRPDLLRLRFSLKEDNKLHIKVSVIEAKYLVGEVGSTNFDKEAQDAARQLAAGLNLLAKAWKPDNSYLDSLYWYDQLYRAVVLRLDYSGFTERTVKALQERVSAGNFEVEFGGHSFIFSYADISYSGLDEEPQVEPTQDEALQGFEAFTHRYTRVNVRDVLRQLLEVATEKSYERTEFLEAQAEAEPDEELNVRVYDEDRLKRLQEAWQELNLIIADHTQQEGQGYEEEEYEYKEEEMSSSVNLVAEKHKLPAPVMDLAVPQDNPLTEVEKTNQSQPEVVFSQPSFVIPSPEAQKSEVISELPSHTEEAVGNSSASIEEVIPVQSQTIPLSGNTN
ncbi:MAG: hypothetical protein WCS37_22715, partial [Chloroflexota bacterium]